MAQLLIGGILAVIMSGLYGYSIYEAVNLAKNCHQLKLVAIYRSPLKI